jgi:Ca-activated chloride channel family protein
MSKDMKKGIVFLLFVLMAVSSEAQTSAMAYFNNGSGQYVHSKLEQAIATVDKGLRKFPADEKLNALKEKLKEEKKKQQQQQQDKKEEEQNKKNQEKKDSKKEDKEEKKQDPKEEESKKEDKEKEQKEEKGDKDSKKEKKPTPQMLKMSPEQIKQLLETMNNEENKTQKKINAHKVKKGRKKHQEKDW